MLSAQRSARRDSLKRALETPERRASKRSRDETAGARRRRAAPQSPFYDMDDAEFAAAVSALAAPAVFADPMEHFFGHSRPYFAHDARPDFAYDDAAVGFRRMRLIRDLPPWRAGDRFGYVQYVFRHDDGPRLELYADGDGRVLATTLRLGYTAMPPNE